MTENPSYTDENDPSRPILSSGSPTQSFTNLSPSNMTEQSTTDRAERATGSEPNDVRLSVLRSGQEQVVSEANLKFYAYAVTVANVPQALAAFIVVGLSAESGEKCESAPLSIWAIVQAIRLLTTVYIAWNLRRESVVDPNLNTERARWLHRIKAPVDNFGLVWLVMGNIWMLGADKGCVDTAPMLMQMCTALIYIGFIGLFLPCIFVLLMLPFVCFCLPCVLRLLAVMAGVTQKQKGASRADLDKLETKQFTPGMFNGLSEDQCSICLNSYEEDETLRLLPCDKRHHFHKDCVDEWLVVNATCPICRARVLDAGNEESDLESGEGSLDDSARRESLVLNAT